MRSPHNPYHVWCHPNKTWLVLYFLNPLTSSENQSDRWKDLTFVILEHSTNRRSEGFCRFDGIKCKMKYGPREQKLTNLMKIKHHQLKPSFYHYQTNKWLENVSGFIIYIIILIVWVLMIRNSYGQITAKGIQRTLSWKFTKPPNSLHLFRNWFKRAEW